MNITVFPSSTSGKIRAIASKSVAHRLLICAAFANTPTSIRCEQTNEDITATVECLCVLGAKIQRNGIFYDVTPIKEINKNGIYLTGGGSNLYGIEDYFSQILGFKVIIPTDSKLSSILGASKLLADKNLLEKIKLV